MKCNPGYRLTAYHIRVKPIRNIALAHLSHQTFLQCGAYPRLGREHLRTTQTRCIHFYLAFLPSLCCDMMCCIVCVVREHLEKPEKKRTKILIPTQTIRKKKSVMCLTLFCVATKRISGSYEDQFVPSFVQSQSARATKEDVL